MRFGPIELSAALAAACLLCPPVRAADAPAPTRMPATFPAQQRAPGDPALIERGDVLYGLHCRSCHGADLRGGDLGGPNLLRSAVVLNDRNGEGIAPVVLQGRSTPGANPMPPLALPEQDIRAIAEFIHSRLAAAQPQGAPPPGEEQPLNILVGDAARGRAQFRDRCAACHAVDGDLRGIARRIPSAENLQNSWVAGRRFGPPDPDADTSSRAVQATVTLRSGERVTGTLRRIDDFIVSLTTPDGRVRSFPRTGSGAAATAVELRDPLAGHRALLPELDDATMHDLTAYLATLR